MNKATVKNILLALVVLAIATMTACNLAIPADTGSTVEVVLDGNEGARGPISFGSDAKWVSIKVVFNSSGVQTGSGVLTKTVSGWKGSIHVSEQGLMTFTATAGSDSVLDKAQVSWVGRQDLTVTATPGLTVTIAVSTPAVGSLGTASGYVFYAKESYSDGWRYLEAAPIDQSMNIQWYNESWDSTGATSIGIGSGSANTATIISQQGAGSYAAMLCKNQVSGGYDDWFLPSKDELNAMYGKKAAIGGFDPTWYWNSSERVGGSVQKQNFTDGTWQPTGKSYMNRVRAVRAF